MISFHSLEDRIVKRFMRDAAHPPQPPKGVPVRAADLPPPVMTLVGKAMFPTEAEIVANPRCRSAVLRVAQKVGNPSGPVPANGGDRPAAGPSQGMASQKHGAAKRRTTVTPAHGRGPGGGSH